MFYNIFYTHVGIPPVRFTCSSHSVPIIFVKITIHYIFDNLLTNQIPNVILYLYRYIYKNIVWYNNIVLFIVVFGSCTSVSLRNLSINDIERISIIDNILYINTFTLLSNTRFLTEVSLLRLLNKKIKSVACTYNIHTPRRHLVHIIIYIYMMCVSVHL